MKEKGIIFEKNSIFCIVNVVKLDVGEGGVIVNQQKVRHKKWTFG